jgi:hypothetical protein
MGPTEFNVYRPTVAFLLPTSRKTGDTPCTFTVSEL